MEMKKILRYITHPFFIALPFSLSLLVLLPPFSQKYKGSTEQIEKHSIKTLHNIYFVDLDNDGFSEKIAISIWMENSTSVHLRASNGSVIDQFNFGGLHNFRFEPLFGDYDQNGKKEIYVFSATNDSVIYINSIEMLEKKKFVKKSKFITKAKPHKGKLSCQIEQIGFADLNGDKNKEAIFYINSGYSLQPRKVYAYDIKNDSIYSSPLSYAKINDATIFDIDYDNYYEIICNTSAPGNTMDTSNIPFHDHSAWIMILDNTLNFKFKPIEVKGYYDIRFTPVRFDNKNYLLAIFSNISKGNEDAKLILFDTKMNKVNERQLNKKHMPGYGRFELENKRIKEFLLVNSKNNTVEKIGKDLIGETIDISKYHLVKILDIDNDNDNEIIAMDKQLTNIFILRKDFSGPVEYAITENLGYSHMHFSVKKNGSAPPQLCFQLGNKTYLFNYLKNPYYILKYPFYIIIYSLFVLFFVLLQKIQKKRIEEKYSTEREITKLQIRTIKNQADPHFIFNALNSISSIIYKEDKDTAYNVLNDFSRLIRSAIVNSDKISISLAEELDFIGNYLKLEKIRFKDKFDYKIELSEEVDKQSKVPRMVIQTYVENAIKHGIMHANSACKLEVLVKQNNGNLIIGIDDDGVGRDQSKQFASHGTGKGLEIMNSIYRLYNKLHNKKIEHTIEDKKDEKGVALGTRIMVRIPL